MAFFVGSWILFMCLPVAFSLEIKVNGPDSGTIGDFEQFTCVLEGNDVTPNMGLEWKYKMKNGDILSVNGEDKLSALESRMNTSGKITHSSFIKLMSSEVAEVVCQQSTTFASKMVEIRTLMSVMMDEDPCSDAEKSGKALVIMRSISMDFTPPYRRAHYVNGESIKITYPTEASQLQLTCLSENGEYPVWSLKKEEASKMKFAVWAQGDMQDKKCRKQIFNIYEVAGHPGDEVKVSLQCASGSASASPVSLTFKIADLPMTRQMDYNSTENCVNEIVESFYNKELTGVGVGSSVLIVLLMAGIAVMKRQVNQQKNINKGLQGGGQPGSSQPASNNPQGTNGVV